MPRASIVLIPLTLSVRVTLRRSDGTKNVFFWIFGSKRRLVRRCECEMLCPKPGTAPVTWQTAAMTLLLQYRAFVRLNQHREAPKITCRHTWLVCGTDRFCETVVS